MDMTNREQMLYIAHSAADHAGLMGLTMSHAFSHDELTPEKNDIWRAEMSVSTNIGMRLRRATLGQTEASALQLLNNLMVFLAADMLDAKRAFNAGASSAHLSRSQCGRLASRMQMRGAMNAISSFAHSVNAVLGEDMEAVRVTQTFDGFVREFDAI